MAAGPSGTGSIPYNIETSVGSDTLQQVVEEIYFSLRRHRESQYVWQSLLLANGHWVTIAMSAFEGARAHSGTKLVNLEVLPGPGPHHLPPRAVAAAPPNHKWRTSYIPRGSPKPTVACLVGLILDAKLTDYTYNVPAHRPGEGYRFDGDRYWQ